LVFGYGLWFIYMRISRSRLRASLLCRLIIWKDDSVSAEAIGCLPPIYDLLIYTKHYLRFSNVKLISLWIGWLRQDSGG